MVARREDEDARGGRFVSRRKLPELDVWDEAYRERTPLQFDLELTARCNNDCRHCYINLPAADDAARARELSSEEIDGVATQAVEMGALWCLVTGGEPLLRDDFAEVYTGLKRLGLLVSVFTNAGLVRDEHIELFRQYPPRDVEVTVYGATEATYERVTRRRGSHAAFVAGVDRLLSAGVRVRLKAMALRSTVHEFDEIGRFCRARTKDFYRFDPLLHLRLDGDPQRNEIIRAERLSPDEIVALERADPERFGALVDLCRTFAGEEPDAGDDSRLLRCNAGMTSFTVGWDGTFRLCSSLGYPGTTADLRAVPLAEAWRDLVPSVRRLRSDSERFRATCARCGLQDLCLWCPAHAALETGALDEWVEYFCEVAKARDRAARGR